MEGIKYITNIMHYQFIFLRFRGTYWQHYNCSVLIFRLRTTVLPEISFRSNNNRINSFFGEFLDPIESISVIMGETGNIYTMAVFCYFRSSSSENHFQRPEICSLHIIDINPFRAWDNFRVVYGHLTSFFFFFLCVIKLFRSNVRNFHTRFIV